CAGGTINWYAGVSGGTSLGTGTSFNTPSIATTTTYYVGCSLIGASPCQSVRVPVVATVNVNLTFSGSQAAGNYRVSQTITSTANVATGVNYYAAKAIVMNPGFQAGGSEVFLAKIEDCP
ncbi:immunoglobulin domain-containing protein, partial [Emticicia agri]